MEVKCDSVNNEFLDTVNLIIEKYEKQKMSQMKIINSYMKYGISRCVSIINSKININENNCIVKKRQV